MTRLPWTAFYWEDWRIATAHLSLAERGAYLTLLQHYYQTGKPLLANASDLLRVCCSRDEAEAQAVTSVLTQFFELRDGFYHNHRADEELEKRAIISKERAKAGAQGGKQKFNKSQAIAKQKPQQSQSQYKTPLTPLSGGNSEPLTAREYKTLTTEVNRIWRENQGANWTDEYVLEKACQRKGIEFNRARTHLGAASA
jgi:uncharacterized protein YdaU (DUF1376 family)